jgi:excisionase family DNA binding protein
MTHSNRDEKDPIRKLGRQSRLLTTPEAAAYLRVSEWTVRKLVKEDKLPDVSGGRGFLIDIRDLDNYIEQAKARRKPQSKSQG